MTICDLLNRAISKSISPEDFLIEVRKLATGSRRTGISLGDETTIYRTRVFFSDTRPKSISELSYPPKEITSLQRCNSKGEQLFYGSFGYKTAFVESRVGINEYVVISEWVNLEPLVLIQIGLTPEKDALDEFNKLLHDVFTWPGADMYEYSSQIAFHFLRADTASGIIYSSICSEFECHNVAIHTDFVDNSMKFVQAILYRVNDISMPEDYEVNEVAYAIPGERGTLIWKDGHTEKLYF